jgi:RND family efflux transporter MFP subunit
MIPEVGSGVVVAGQPGKGPFAPVAFWPEGRRNAQDLAEVAERALAERHGLVVRRDTRESPDGPVRPRYAVAYPIQSDDKVYGVVALDIAPRPDAELQAVLRQLQWGSAWLELLVNRQETAAANGPRERLQAVLDLQASALGQERFYGAATAFVTALATRLQCDRASVGFVRRGHVRVRAVSHSAQFGRRTNLIRAIGAAMDEAADQQGTVVYPESADGPPLIARAHEELGRQHGEAVCSVVLTEGTRVVGVLTLERPADRPFDLRTVELCEAVGAVVGPILELRRRDDRWLLTKAIDAGRRLLGRLIGPRHIGFKLATVGAIAAAVFLAQAQGEYRVSARTVMEAAVKRAAVAPFNGYLKGAPVRAGDVVRKGQVLATLDDRELVLERLKWQSQEEQYAQQRAQALAGRNAAQIAIASAQMAQARAQMALLDEQLARTRVLAEFDGVVVTGDLSDSLGSPVERGKVLFEVAPLDAYRVVLQVDERDIADVRVDQRGQILLSAAPHTPIPFTVENITPVSTAREGRNYFRVEARLAETPERLRPGLEGVGKIEVERRLLVWVWTRQVIDWLRLQLWTWLP